MKYVGGVAVLLLGLVGCGDNIKVAGGGLDGGFDGSPGSDESSPDVDAAVAAMCPGSATLTVTGLPQTAASDGTTLYISVVAPSGQAQLLSRPLAGGSQTTIKTVPSGTFALSSYADAVFYAAQLAGSNIEVHQLVGTTDTLLATFAAAGEIRIAANAMDVYVADSTSAGTTIKSLSRSGAAVQSLVTVASTAGTTSDLAAGASTVAVHTMTPYGWSVFPFASPSTPTTYVDTSGGSVVAADVGFALTAHMLTSHTRTITWSTFYPTTEQLSTTTYTDSGYALVAADADQLFVTFTEGTTTRLLAQAVDASHHFQGQTPLCSYAAAIGAQDAGHLYSFVDSTVLVIPKP